MASGDKEECWDSCSQDWCGRVPVVSNNLRWSRISWQTLRSLMTRMEEAATDPSTFQHNQAWRPRDGLKDITEDLEMADANKGYKFMISSTFWCCINIKISVFPLKSLLLFSCSVVSDPVTPWVVAHQTSLPFTISRSLLKLMSIELVIPSNHLILCRSLLLLPSIFPSIRVFSISGLFTSGGQSNGASASASVHPVKIRGWFPLGLTGWISLQSKGLSRVFSNTTVQKHQFFNAQPSVWSNSHIHTWLLEKQLPWLDGPLLTK